MNDNNSSGNFDVYARFTNDGLKDMYKTTANIIGVDEEIFQKYYLQMDTLFLRYNKGFYQLYKHK